MALRADGVVLAYWSNRRTEGHGQGDCSDFSFHRWCRAIVAQGVPNGADLAPFSSGWRGPAESEPEMFERIACLVRRTHDYRLQRERDHLFLQCRRCGACTPGWDLDAEGSIVAAPATSPGLGLNLPSNRFRLVFDD